MKWLTADRELRDLQAEFMRLRSRKFNINGFKTGPALLDERLDWKQVPSNQFATPSSMHAAGWLMDQTRDEQGRLV